MSILNVTPENLNLSLKDIAVPDVWVGVAYGVDYDPSIVTTLRRQLTHAIGDLTSPIPSGPQIRRIIHDVLGIWVSVRKCNRLVFEKGNQLIKYYDIYAPKDLYPDGLPPQSEFNIKSSKHGVGITSVHVSIHYYRKAPHSQYKF